MSAGAAPAAVQHVITSEGRVLGEPHPCGNNPWRVTCSCGQDFIRAYLSDAREAQARHGSPLSPPTGPRAGLNQEPTVIEAAGRRGDTSDGHYPDCVIHHDPDDSPCWDDQDVTEARLQGRDYEAWADL